MIDILFYIVGFAAIMGLYAIAARNDWADRFGSFLTDRALHRPALHFMAFAFFMVAVLVAVFGVWVVYVGKITSLFNGTLLGMVGIWLVTVARFIRK